MNKLERFFTKIEVTPDGCWEWKGSKYPNGYGIFHAKTRTETNGGKRNRGVLAHRWAYTQLVGEIPDGMTLDHLCRNRGCVNAFDHLEPVTFQENVRRGAVLRYVTCPDGHPLDGVKKNRKGQTRYCLECNRVRVRAAQHRKQRLSEIAEVHR